MAKKKNTTDVIEIEKLIETLGPLVAEGPFWRWNWDYSGRYDLGKRTIGSIAKRAFPFGSVPPTTVELKEPIYLTEEALMTKEKFELQKGMMIEQVVFA